MAPLQAAERAALEGFLSSKRGSRQLIPDSVALLVTYFADKGTTLAELNTARPAAPAQVEVWLEEWRDYARAAKLPDRADVNNVARWIDEESTAAANQGLRAGKSAAVAEALALKGFRLSRADELAIDAALASADAGDCTAQCRHVNVVFQLYFGQSPGEEEKKSFLDLRSAGNSSAEGDPVVDVRRFPSYFKLMKNSSVPTLERAITAKTEEIWRGG